MWKDTGSHNQLADILPFFKILGSALFINHTILKDLSSVDSSMLET